jgi:16S rRNA (guanine966-N2)-methyltransferase
VRVVGGTLSGRTLKAPPGRDTRPTSDRVREAMFNLLASRTAFAGAAVLDLFAGSGALALEALSRGAASATLVERHGPTLAVAKANAAALGLTSAIRPLRADALVFLRRPPAGAFDVAFADPPYGQGLALAVAERWLEVPFAHRLGVEHSSKERLPDGETRKYGTTSITFYRAESPLPIP